MNSLRRIFASLSAASLAAAGLGLGVAAAAPAASAAGSAASAPLVEASATASTPDEGGSLGWVVLRGRMPAAGDVTSVTVDVPAGSVPSGQLEMNWGLIPFVGDASAPEPFTAMTASANGTSWTGPVLPQAAVAPTGAGDLGAFAPVLVALRGLSDPPGQAEFPITLVLNEADGATVTTNFQVTAYPTSSPPLQLTAAAGYLSLPVGDLRPVNGVGYVGATSLDPSQAMGNLANASYQGCSSSSPLPTLVAPDGQTTHPLGTACNFSFPEDAQDGISPGPWEIDVPGVGSTWITNYAETGPQIHDYAEPGAPVTIAVGPEAGPAVLAESTGGFFQGPLWVTPVGYPWAKALSTTWGQGDATVTVTPPTLPSPDTANSELSSFLEVQDPWVYPGGEGAGDGASTRSLLDYQALNSKVAVSPIPSSLPDGESVTFTTTLSATAWNAVSGAFEPLTAAQFEETHLASSVDVQAVALISQTSDSHTYGEPSCSVSLISGAGTPVETWQVTSDGPPSTPELDPCQLRISGGAEQLSPGAYAALQPIATVGSLWTATPATDTINVTPTPAVPKQVVTLAGSGTVNLQVDTPAPGVVATATLPNGDPAPGVIVRFTTPTGVNFATGSTTATEVTNSDGQATSPNLVAYQATNGQLTAVPTGIEAGSPVAGDSTTGEGTWTIVATSPPVTCYLCQQLPPRRSNSRRSRSRRRRWRGSS